MLKGQRTIEKSMSQQEIDAKMAFYTLKKPFGLVKAGCEIPEILLNETYDTYNVDTNRVCTAIRVAMHIENYIVEVAEKVYSKGIRAPWFSETDTILQKKLS